MLSTTHSLNDVKKNLIDQPNEYGYKDKIEFNAGILNALEKAELFFMIPAIGQGKYDYISGKNKTNLSIDEKYIYAGETNLATSIFLEDSGRKELQRSGGINQNMGQGSNDIEVGKSGVSLDFYKEGMSLMALAGYYFSYGYSNTGIKGNWTREI